MGYFIFIILSAGLIFFLYKVQSPSQKAENHKSEVFFPKDQDIEKYSSLLKEATSYKKEDIEKSIELIRSALDITKSYPVSAKRQAITKLADYERINGNFQSSLTILHQAYKESIYSNDFYMRAMEASILISYIDIQLRKMNIKNFSFQTEADKLQIIALAVQGRVDSIKDRLPQSLTNLEIKEFIELHSRTLEFFQDNDPLNNDKNWVSNQSLNNAYFKLIEEIDQGIEEKIINLLREVIT
ncbi:hypothetical protein M9C83_02385 [SAR86 cluster bacterium]|nr:hypothetical protein M9C83_02385 [SAR86 cluster bacterium]